MGLGDYLSWKDVFVPGSTAAGTLIKKAGEPGGLLPEEERRRKLLEEQAGKAGDFADYGEGGFRGLSTAADNNRALLEAHATGKDSFSRETLRQGLEQNLNNQRSFAASASPANAAMAARTAMTNMGRANAGMAGQAALADIAERQAFAKALADATLQQRQQELQAALGSRGNAITALGGGNPFERDKSWIEKFGPAIAAGAGLAMKGGGG